MWSHASAQMYATHPHTSTHIHTHPHTSTHIHTHPHTCVGTRQVIRFGLS